MDKFLMSLPDKTQYYCDKLDLDKYNITFTNKPYSKYINFRRRMNILFIKMKLPFIKGLVRRISKKVYDPKIVDAIINDTGLAIIDAYVNLDLLYLIKKYKPKRAFLLIWNPLSDEKAKLYKKYMRIENIYSYSIEESKKYNFNHFNDFYLMTYPYEKKPIVRDFYFLGRDKNRMELIEDFSKLIKDKYTYQFDIYTEFLEKRKFGNPLFNYFDEYLPFKDYLNRVFESRCIIDVNATSNITFRTLEALIFEKKYICNNPNFKNMDFYNTNNILIIDEKTTLSDIDEFLEKPYIKIDFEILKRYDVYTVYNNFKKKCEEIK